MQCSHNKSGLWCWAFWREATDAESSLDSESDWERWRKYLSCQGVRATATPKLPPQSFSSWYGACGEIFAKRKGFTGMVYNSGVGDAPRAIANADGIRPMLACQAAPVDHDRHLMHLRFCHSNEQHVKAVEALRKPP